MRKRGIALRAAVPVAVPVFVLGLGAAAATAVAPAGTAAGGVLSCLATPTVTSAWSGGFDLQFVITNTGTEAFGSWTVTFDLPLGDTVYTTWNGEIQQSGRHVVATNYPSSGYNGTIQPGGSASSFGMVVGGTGGDAVTDVTCTPSLLPTE